MMKNIINIFIFFILCISNMGLTSRAFIAEETGLNLYNTIDEGYEKIDQINFEYELSGEDESIKDKVNILITQHYALTKQNITDCIKGDLAPSHVIDIAYGNTKILFEKLGDSCRNNENSVDQGTLNTIQKIIQDHYNETRNIASDKTKQIQKIGSVGLYTDGIIENGSFDLIEDIEKIDSIIFTQEIIYQGEEYEDFNKSFQDKQEEKKEVINNNLTDPAVINENNGVGLAINSTNTENPINTNNIDLNILENFNSEDSYYGSSSNYVCVDNQENHGFNPENIDQLLNGNNTVGTGGTNGSQSNNNNNGTQAGNQAGNQNEGNNNSKSNSISNKNPESLAGNYKTINDNAVWPCSDFFCITIDFVVHQHQLLGGGPNITIEYLIDRSNQHLRKFANASLAPAKMTTQNFELGLKDLNLSDMFHMSFQVSTKPVPILKLENKLESSGDSSSGEDNSDFSSNTLIEKYYKAHNIDYKRRNDITVFTSKQGKYKSLLNSTNLEINNFLEKQRELDKLLLKNTLKAELITKSVYKKVSIDTLGDFGTQFTELNNFSTSMRDYTQSLSDIIKAMIKIPIDG